jgi:hypothetical protein
VVFLVGLTFPACCLIITESFCIDSEVLNGIQNPLGSLLSTLVDPFLVRFHVFLGASSADIAICCTKSPDDVLSHQDESRFRMINSKTHPRALSSFESDLHPPAAIVLCRYRIKVKSSC